MMLKKTVIQLMAINPLILLSSAGLLAVAILFLKFAKPYFKKLSKNRIAPAQPSPLISTLLKQYQQSFKLMRKWKPTRWRSVKPCYLILDYSNKNRGDFLHSWPISINNRLPFIGDSQVTAQANQEIIASNLDSGIFISISDSDDITKENLNLSLWNGFLKILKKYYPRPLTGIITVIDTDILANEQATANFVNYLEKRIAMVAYQLQIYTPCHLVISQSQMLPGYTEVINALIAKFKIPFVKIDIMPNINSEQILNYFFNNFRFHFHKDEFESRNMESLFILTSSLARKTPQLSTLLERLKSINIETRFLFQKLYLLSNQAGDPTWQSFSDTFGLKFATNSYEYKALHESQLSKFLATLSATHQARYLKFKIHKKRFVNLFLGAFLLISCAILNYDFYQHYQLEQQQENRLIGDIQKLTAFTSINQEQQWQLLANFFSNISIFKENLASSANHIVAANSIEPTLTDFENTIANSIFLPLVKQTLASMLNDSWLSYNKLNTTFSAYLSFYENSASHHAALIKIMHNYWKGGATTLNDAALTSYLQKYISNWNVIPTTINDNLLNSVYARLNKRTHVQYAFDTFYKLSQTQSLIEPANWYDAKIWNATSLVTPIPYLYTAEGYWKIVDTNLPTLIQQIIQDYQAIPRGNMLPPDQTALSNAILQQYFSNFQKCWQNAFQGYRLIAVNDLKQVETLINLLTTQPSPLLAVLQPIAQQKLALSTETLLALEPDNQAFIQQLNALAALPTSPNFTQLITQLKSIEQQLTNIQNNTDEAAFNVFSDPKNVLRIQLETFEQQVASLPDPVKSWMLQLSNEIWRLLMEGTYRHLNAAWDRLIFQDFNQYLAPCYPFTKDANCEIPIKDYANFFAPEGKLDNFYLTYLKYFVENSMDGFQWKSVHGQFLSKSSSLLKSLNDLYAIQKLLFNPSTKQLQLGLTIKPLSLTSNAKQMDLSFGNEKLTYSHGAQPILQLTWPLAVSNIAITFTDLDDTSHGNALNSAWSFFKLIDQYSLVKQSDLNSYKLIIKIKNFTGIYSVQTDSQSNPFNNAIWKNFSLPSNL